MSLALQARRTGQRAHRLLQPPDLRAQRLLHDEHPLRRMGQGAIADVSWASLLTIISSGPASVQPVSGASYRGGGAARTAPTSDPARWLASPNLVIPPQARRAEGASRPRARARSTASWRLWTPNLAYRWRMWVPTVFTDRNSSLAISCAVRWVGRERRTRISLSVSCSSRLPLRAHPAWLPGDGAELFPASRLRISAIGAASAGPRRAWPPSRARAGGSRN